MKWADLHRSAATMLCAIEWAWMQTYLSVKGTLKLSDITESQVHSFFMEARVDGSLEPDIMAVAVELKKQTLKNN